MNKESYPIIENEEFFYTFISTGKNRNILKAVVFQTIEINEYNLVLADFDAQNSVWSDTSASNNGDVIKIITTVMDITSLFLNKQKLAKVFIQANSEPKNRVYNRIFKNYYREITLKYHIEGRNENGVEIYSIEKTYFSFYIYNK